MDNVGYLCGDFSKTLVEAVVVVAPSVVVSITSIIFSSHKIKTTKTASNHFNNACNTCGY